MLQEGLEVISIDNYVAGKRANLAALKAYPGFREVDCDILDQKKLECFFEGVDVVFNQAASKMTVCLRDPALDLQVNAQGTFNVLELSRKYGIKKVVHVSTGSVYGDAQYYPTDELHPLNPTSYYGVSKLAGEKYARAFAHLYDLDVTMLRYFHVYGPRQESSDVGGVVSIFARRALHDQPLVIYGDGSQLRSFTYVEDVVDINKLVALRAQSKGEAYNCASGIKVTILELAQKVLAYYGKENLEIQFEDWRLGDILKFDVDNAKLKELNFEFRTDFNAGLVRTLEWSRSFFTK